MTKDRLYRKILDQMLTAGLDFKEASKIADEEAERIYHVMADDARADAKTYGRNRW
jgi:hypothetical protein